MYKNLEDFTDDLEETFSTIFNMNYITTETPIYDPKTGTIQVNCYFIGEDGSRYGFGFPVYGKIPYEKQKKYICKDVFNKLYEYYVERK